jgi:hypothetical protein
MSMQGKVALAISGDLLRDKAPFVTGVAMPVDDSADKMINHEMRMT